MKQVKILNLVPWVILISLVVGWLVLLRPQSLNGPASYIVVAGHSMEPTFFTGDLAITSARLDYKVGDIVTFTVQNNTVIHRIVGGSAEEGFLTRGDGNNGRIDSWRVSPADIKGRLWFRIPKGGTYITNLFSYVRQPLFRGILAGAVGILLLGDVFRRVRRGRLEMRDRRRKYYNASRWGVRL